MSKQTDNPFFHNDGTMTLSRLSPFSGTLHTKRLTATREQYEAWSLGSTMVQDAFPDLSADDREFILTGITAEEWEKTFGRKSA